MATIGTFARSGNEFKGSISTLFIQAKNVRFVPEDNHGNDKAPTHRMFSGTTVIGAAWSKKNREEREYLSVQIRRFSGNISKTATFIGMERSALHRKLKLLGMTDRRD